jgi:hypothetical protein
MPKIIKKVLTGLISALAERYNIIEIPPIKAGIVEYDDAIIEIIIKPLIMRACLISLPCCKDKAAACGRNIVDSIVDICFFTNS